MVEKIYYFLYDENENKTYKIHNDSVILTVIKGNKEYLTSPSCGARATAVYMDKRLNTKEYQEWYDTCVRPILSLSNSLPAICFI